MVVRVERPEWAAPEWAGLEEWEAEVLRAARAVRVEWVEWVEALRRAVRAVLAKWVVLAVLVEAPNLWTRAIAGAVFPGKSVSPRIRS